MENTLRKNYSTKLKTQAFNDIYADWKEKSTVELNEDIWNQIDIFGNIDKKLFSNKINE